MVNDSIFPRKDKAGKNFAGVANIKWTKPINDRSSLRVKKLTTRVLRKGVDVEESRNRALSDRRFEEQGCDRQSREDYPFITGYPTERPRGNVSGS